MDVCPIKIMAYATIVTENLLIRGDVCKTTEAYGKANY
jgi:hypothetical protein